VADAARTEKTICLAVSPSLKAYGIPGRARLFEVVQKVEEVNALRREEAPGRKLKGVSYDAEKLHRNRELAVDYLVAVPRMARYMEWSTKIYGIYLKYVAPEDIHVYSIDEVFMDVTNYLCTYEMTARELAKKIALDVRRTTGITATAGIGSNLFLCKVAMDIMAKHIPADEDGVCTAELDEMSYRRQLWTHKPLTDFWRVGRGYARKLEAQGLYTMGDIARCSVGGPADYYNAELLYRMFGVNAELLIDHAWGWEPCTMAEIKAYKPKASSVGSGQVLQCPYSFEKARTVLLEMADALALDLVDKGLMTDQIILTVGFDIENLKNPDQRERYQGVVVTDFYGRKIPKHAHGTANLGRMTSSSKQILSAVEELYERIVERTLLIRRLNLTANHVTGQDGVLESKDAEQLDLFKDCASETKEKEEQKREMELQKTLLSIKRRYGKNAILKGLSLEIGATAMERNRQIGGHKA